MCSLAGRQPAPGLDPAERAGKAPARGGDVTSGVAVFAPASVSYGDGVVIADDPSSVTADSVSVGAGVGVMSGPVADDPGEPASVSVPASGNVAGGDGGTSADERSSGASYEENPCNRTFYCDDGDDDDDGDDGDDDVGEDDGDGDEYDDWFAVADDEEIRTIATAELQPFYGHLGGERPTAVFDLAGELDTDPEFTDGYSCLETIVEENSDDMQSEAESLHSGPDSWGWSAGSEERGSPAAQAAGPPGWTWCLEPSDSTGGADDWGSEDECEPPSRIRRASAGDELLETSSLRHSRDMDWGEPITKSCVGAPLFGGLPPARPLAATATAAWRQSPVLLSQVAPLSAGDFRGHRWCVDNEPISAELRDPNGRRYSDPGAVSDVNTASWRPSSASADPVVTEGRQGSPDRAAPTPCRAPPPPQATSRGTDESAVAGSRATKVLGAARNGQLGVSVAERYTTSARQPDGGAAISSTGPADAEVCGAATAGPKWDLGSCEDFENLDRRIESLTFDFEEEERRTLQTLECLESLDSTIDQRLMFQRLLAEHEVAPVSEKCREAVRRFHSSGDLTMISNSATERCSRPAVRAICAGQENTETDGDASPAPIILRTLETTGPRPHARVDLLRHSSENLSEDSGFGEQPASARSSSETSSPPPREEATRQMEATPSRMRRRCQSTPDLSPSVQRRRRLLELIGRDERRRARVYVDAAASDARDSSSLGVDSRRPSSPQQRQGPANVAPALSMRLSGAPPPASGKDRPVPAPRTLATRPAAVYQNVPPTAWLATQAAASADTKGTSRPDSQVNGSCSPARPARRSVHQAGTCSVNCDEVAARPGSATYRGFARPTLDAPLDDDAKSDDSVMVSVASRSFEPELNRRAETGDFELSGAGDRWQAVTERASPGARALTPTTGAGYTSESRDICVTNIKAQPSRMLHRAAGRPKPLDIASAQEFLSLEMAGGERVTADVSVFSPDVEAGVHHIRTAGPPEGAGGAVTGGGGGAADWPIAASAAAGPAVPGNRRWRSQWDLSTVAAGRGVGGAAARPLGGSAGDLSAGPEMDAPPSTAAGSWGRGETVTPHVTRLNGHGLGCPDWLHASMEPDAASEASPVGGFFSRVAVTAGLPDNAASLPGLRRHPGRPELTPGCDQDNAQAGMVRRYGPQGGVEVRINRQHGQPPPVPAGRVKGVQFSPLVSEVRWRETYLDEERGAPPRPPPPTEEYERRVTPSPPQPPPRTKSLSASQSSEMQRLRVSYSVDSGDGGGVRRQVITCERAGGPALPPTDGREPERRPAAGPTSAADKSPNMLERFGLSRLSGARWRPRPAPVTCRSPSPGAVSSVVVRESEIVSPRAEVVTVPEVNAAGEGVVTSTPRPAARLAWDTSSRDSSAEAVLSARRADRLLSSINSSPEHTTPPEEPPAAKPPLPPRIGPSQVTRARLTSARHQFLGALTGTSGGPAPRAAPPPPPLIPDTRPAGGDAAQVRDAFERFRRQAREDRERLAQSTPDLSLIETTTRGLVRSPSPSRPAAHHQPPPRQEKRLDSSYEIDWGASTATVRAARRDRTDGSPAPAQRPLPCQETDLDAIVRGLQQFIDDISPRREKAKSLLNLEDGDEQLGRATAADTRAKSMEFLLDDENKATTLPPENELMRGGDAARQLSRHELRFQRSLRNLNTPEWYRKSTRPPAIQRRSNDTGSLAGGWSGLSSKSSSKESLPLSSTPAATPTPLPRRGDWRSFRAARETVSVPATAAASPVPLCRRASAGSGRRPPPPPPVSAVSALRRPYLGWRSQERLSGQGYQTPVERLASSFRSQPGVRRPVAGRDGKADEQRPSPPGDDVHSSIREVTDAIVHYFDPDVHTQHCRVDSPRPASSLAEARCSREASPSKQRSLWLETAFVGSRPADGSADLTKDGRTVASLPEPAPPRPKQEQFELGCATSGDIHNHRRSVGDATCAARSSVTMEDVLDSLLAMRRPSPSDRSCRR